MAALDPPPPPPRVSPTLSRPFSISDLMILVAGCAVGLTWVRAAGLDSELSWPVQFLAWRMLWRSWLQAPVPVLASLGLATLICRCRSPRPSVRRLLRQPGSTALVLLALITAYVGSVLLAGLVLEPLVAALRLPSSTTNKTIYPSKLTSLAWQMNNAGKLVAVVWGFQALAGRWRPDRSWMDRTGRLVGFSLITLDFLALLGLALRL